jgi:hypothetical protein
METRKRAKTFFIKKKRYIYLHIKQIIYYAQKDLRWQLAIFSI